MIASGKQSVMAAPATKKAAPEDAALKFAGEGEDQFFA